MEPTVVSISFCDSSSMFIGDYRITSFLDKIDVSVKSRVMGYRKESDIKMAIASQLYQYRLLRQFISTGDLVTIHKEQYGRPIISIDGMSSSTKYSVSHHSDQVVFVSSTLNVGCDLLGVNYCQPMQQIDSYLQCLRSYLHPNELRRLDTTLDASSRLQLFSLFWTLKEAYLKAKGVGIADPDQPLSSIDFSTASSNGDSWIVSFRSWFLLAWVVDDRHIAAVAVDLEQSIVSVKVTCIESGSNRKYDIESNAQRLHIRICKEDIHDLVKSF